MFENFYSNFALQQESQFHCIENKVILISDCRDDSDWKDNRYGGDGKSRCKDLTLDWCNNHGKYSDEARRACPRSCGLC